jgi:hypothetical protein
MQFSRRFEIGAWVIYIFVANTIGATSVLMERARNGAMGITWEPFVWEYTSGIVSLLLIPFILLIDQRIPLRTETWRKSIAVHLAATVPFSLVHVGAMVALRKGIYALFGSRYDFGNVAIELLYEYRKDLLSYFLILAAIYAYRMFRANHSGADYDGDAADSHADQFLVKSRGLVRRIPPSSVDWVEAAGNYVILHVGSSSHPLRDTMKGIAERLGDAFCRVHRSAIINLARVSGVSPASGGDLLVRLHDGTEIRCSRTMRPDLERRLAEAC